MTITIGQVTVETNDAVQAKDFRAVVRAGPQVMELSLGQAHAIMRALGFALNPDTSKGRFQ